MRAFISYSVNDQDQMIVTLLSNHLRKSGFQATASQSFYSANLDYTTKRKIETSQVCFGVITKNGRSKKRVLLEWEYSKDKGIPNLLLIEDGIEVKRSFKGNYIRFNRRSPQVAIDEINERMSNQSQSDGGVWPWLVGGVALLGIIGLLSKKD